MDSNAAAPAQIAPFEGKIPSSGERRRTSRLCITIPVVLSGKDASGKAFREECWTMSISRHGASVKILRAIAPGAELLIENPCLGTTALARALRFKEGQSARDLGVVALELINVKNVWGIRYPPKDWRLDTFPSAGLEISGRPPSAADIHEIDLEGSLSFLRTQDATAYAPLQPSVLPVSGSTAPTYAELSGQPGARESTGLNSMPAMEETLRRLEQGQADMLAAQQRLACSVETIAASCAHLEGRLSEARKGEKKLREQLASLLERCGTQFAEQQAQLASEIQAQIDSAAAQATVEPRRARKASGRSSAPTKCARRGRRPKEPKPPQPVADPPEETR